MNATAEKKATGSVKQRKTRTPKATRAANTMTEALKAKLEEIVRLRNSRNKNELATRYSEAVLLVEIANEEENGDGSKYGKQAVKRLADALREPETSLRATMRLATNFAKAEIDQIQETKMANGQSLSYSHARALGRVDKGERTDLVDKATKQCWTAAELEDEIQRSRQAKREGNGKNKPGSATTRAFALVISRTAKQATTFCKSLKARAGESTQTLDESAKKLKHDDISDKLIDSAKACASILQDVADEAGTQAIQAKAAVRHLEGARRPTEGAGQEAKEAS
jgi:hypothetical protein